jgi:hypothetical protein
VIVDTGSSLANKLLLLESIKMALGTKRKHSETFDRNELYDCKGLNIKILNILFDAYSEAIRIQDNFGLLPLHYACLNEVSTVDIIMSLVKLYPESILVRCTSD